MDKAKASVKDFLSKSGHHDTTTHEQVATAVTEETVVPTQHEKVTPVIEKERHQDHYHTSVQPVKHSETLPETHHHNPAAVEHRTIEHSDENKVKQQLASEASQFRDTSQRIEGERTTTTEPTLVGEHVHHHVHETIQPVVHKQTVEPHVVHTTVPVHETHHNEAKHHAATALPAMTMEEFKKGGGTLLGDKERHGQYDGCPPEHIGGHHQGDRSTVSTSSKMNRKPDSPIEGSMNGGSNVKGTADARAAATAAARGDGPLNSHKHESVR